MLFRGNDRSSLPTLVRQLLNDGVEVARAEVQLQKARVSARIAGAKTGIILLLAAAIVALLAAIGFVVAMVLALAPLVGPGYAGLIILAIGVVIAAILGSIGVRRLSSRPAAVAEILP